MVFGKYGVACLTLISLLAFAVQTNCQMSKWYPTKWAVLQAGNHYFEEKAGFSTTGSFNPYVRFRSDGYNVNPTNIISSSRSIIDITKKHAAIRVMINNKGYCFVMDYPKIPTRQSIEQRKQKIIKQTKVHKMVVDGISPMSIDMFKSMYEQGHLKSRIFDVCEKDAVFKIKDAPPPVTGMMSPPLPSGGKVKVSLLLPNRGTVVESRLIEIHGIPSVMIP